MSSSSARAFPTRGPKAGRSRPEHALPPTPTPREPAETFNITIAFSLPYEPTREAARRKLNDVTEAVKAAVVTEGGVVQVIRTVGVRPT